MFCKIAHIPSFILVFLFLMGLLTCKPILAQKTDFNKVVPPIDTRAKEYADVLVQLAWQNNPKYEALQTEQEIAAEEIKITQLEWTRDFAASFNLNEANIRNIGDNQFGTNIFFPRYNFQATFNVGNLITRKNKVNIARHHLAVAENETNQAKLQLRAEVLRRYERYLAAMELLKIRAKAAEDMYASYLLAKSYTELGKGELSELNNATEGYNRALENKLMAETNLKTTKIDLEEIIGLRLEDIFEEKYPKKN
ncbi:MAG TPA: TolC family protein [Chitinophagales bacterium]|nr:TolC family protein [Chitinophagales bacterium]